MEYDKEAVFEFISAFEVDEKTTMQNIVIEVAERFDLDVETANALMFEWMRTTR